MASVHPWGDAHEGHYFKADELEANKAIGRGLKRQQQQIRGRLAKKALKKGVLLDKK